ncbi:MAG: hypothetical protein RBQ72_09970 [Desulfobacterium sp.]|jgi:uncharacterized membrane protein required for colicin V production|nr:hypothetical protein [Desulfobacterium sp.]
MLLNMYISATALLILGALSGAAYGFISGFPIFKTIIYCFAGGFAGSVAGAFLFTFLYFKSTDTDSSGKDKERD